ncbi:sigma-70 family RNA polymerase sigma factor [Conexibacter sp. JD483]|uniref:RNA polymerase sigma factor n=1 Tax=unclassified Conexibacter TaxID=2627773 RepID=UPI00271623D4|nr:MULTISPECIES: sigma-70 family RNA polymerase sigma factor [unclassified Conexibacter]MDO8184596.1 sigma-70 family RNA polymerase sigma factor [Conexibacter sp. CPCC 205706]MDO8197902.1 sigma-70 family RNA polymerase sigma factor [Conexibacter sp. CPCC 205762]MDR9370133.1 sigma-70 family RNA polymerase sigma factor [Conexibacter sp. JD483]
MTAPADRAAPAAAPSPPAGGADPARARLEALYVAHAVAVHAYARRRTDPASAEDLVAETFLVAWRRLDRVPADALPWLYATAGRLLANHRRGEARRAALAARVGRERAVVAGIGGAAAGGTELSDDGERLLRGLAALRPADREALLLTAWEGLEPARAATAMGCTKATFHVRLHRARRRLEAALERERAAAEVQASAGRATGGGVDADAAAASGSIEEART